MADPLYPYGAPFGPDDLALEQWPPPEWAEPAALPHIAPPGMVAEEPPPPEQADGIDQIQAAPAPEVTPPASYGFEVPPEELQGPEQPLDPYATPFAPPPAGGLPLVAAEPPAQDLDALRPQLMGLDLDRPAMAADEEGTPADDYADAMTGEIDAEQLAAETARAEAARLQEEAAAREAAYAKSRADLDELTRARKEADAVADAKMSEIEREAQALADERIEPGRWMRTASASQKLGAAILAIGGGFLSPHTGGRNSGLETLRGIINEDIDAQKADLANRRASLGERRGLVAAMYERNGDVFASGEAARLAQLKLVDQELAAQAAQYDPRGTTARRIQAARLGVQQEQAKASAAARQQAWSNAMAERKMRQDEEEARRANAARWAGIKLQREGLAMRQRELDDAKAAREAAERAKLAEKQGEKVEKQAIYGFDAKPLTNKDGSTWTAPTEKEAQELRAGMAGNGQMVGILDDMILLRKKYGSSRRFINSPEYQRAKVQAAMLTAAYKRGENMGALDKGLLEFMEQLTGDPTSVYSNLDRWDEMRDKTIDGMNIQLRSKGYTGRRIEVDRPTLASEIRTSTEDDVANIGQAETRIGVRPAEPRVAAVDQYYSGIRAGLAKFAGDTPAQVIPEYDAAIEEIEGVRRKELQRAGEIFARARRLEERRKAGELTAEESRWIEQLPERQDAQAQVMGALDDKIAELREERGKYDSTLRLEESDATRPRGIADTAR